MNELYIVLSAAVATSGLAYSVWILFEVARILYYMFSWLIYCSYIRMHYYYLFIYLMNDIVRSYLNCPVDTSYTKKSIHMHMTAS